MSFTGLTKALRKHYGPPQLPPARGPFQLVLWENACYLLPDERRKEVFEGIQSRIGLTPQAIATADQSSLLDLAKRGGMRPETRVFRWREIARIALAQFDGDLDPILKWPYEKAKRALKQFPNIGDPGAEKILLFCGLSGGGLPLESNGLRVLTRLGYGRTLKQYGATYRSVQEAIAAELPKSPKPLLDAHVLLREHGKTICKTTRPECAHCPLHGSCAFVSTPSPCPPR